MSAAATGRSSAKAAIGLSSSGSMKSMAKGYIRPHIFINTGFALMQTGGSGKMRE